MGDLAPRSSGNPGKQETTHSATSGWVDTAQQLRALRESQRRAWGNVDNSTLGRYLADEVDAGERARVEAEMASHPELARLTELVRDVLADFQPEDVPVPVIPAPLELPVLPPVAENAPVLPAAPLPEVASVTPVLWTSPAETSPPLPASPPRVGFLRRYRHELSLLVAACVLFGLGLSLFRITSPAEAVNELSIAQARPETQSSFPLPPDAVVLATLKPLSLDHLDQQLNQERAAARPVDAGRYESAYFQVARTARLENHPRFAQSLEHLGNTLKEQGNLALAEPHLQQAYNIRCQNVGPNAPETLRAASNLAGMYQLALNTTENESRLGGPRMGWPQAKREPAGILPGAVGLHGMAEPAVASLPAVGPVRSHGDRDARFRDLQDVRSRITAQAPEKVRRSIVPILIQSLRHSTQPDERLALIHAMSRLGCAARDATPLLLDLVRKSDNPDEIQAALQTLGRIGAGMPGVPDVLREVVVNHPEHSLAAGEALLALGPVGREILADLDAAEQTLRKQAEDLRRGDAKDKRAEQLEANANRVANLRRVSEDPTARVGILDAACLFTSSKFHAVLRRLDQLASAPQRQVFIETLARPLDGGDRSLAQRVRLVGTQGLYVLLSREPATVQMHVAPALRQAGFTPTRERELSETLEGLLASGRNDELLDRILAALPPETSDPSK